VGGLLAAARALRLSRLQAALVGLVLIVALARLPFTLVTDVRGARADGRLSPVAVSEARGRDAVAGTDIVLLRAARVRIPPDASYAIVRGGRWGTPGHPNRRAAFVWESGESWTQYDLAPRLEVSLRRARWLLIRDATPGAVGVRRPLHAWRFGVDWLVERRT
jgi:hypothetical protein